MGECGCTPQLDLNDGPGKLELDAKLAAGRVVFGLARVLAGFIGGDGGMGV